MGMTADDAREQLAAQMATNTLPAEGLQATQTEVVGTHVLQGNQLDSYIPADLRDRYEFYSYRHAAEILSTSCRTEFDDLLNCLRAFSITLADISTAGGNESQIPKKLNALLRPLGWLETRVSGDLLVRRLTKSETIQETKKGRRAVEREQTHVLPNFIDGHLIDYVKNRVAFDMEWNSKDQTFDRDLVAFSAFAQTGIISVGVLLTRSAQLNPIFKQLGLHNKYGASTTWMGKLLPRLEAGRNGACPVLAVGIRPAVISDVSTLLAEQGVSNDQQ